jgi:hypothetical protein
MNETMRRKKSSSFTIPAQSVRSVEALAIQGTTALKFKRM